MKHSTIVAVAFCGVLAFALTGCKYDDAEGAVPEDATVTDVSTDADANGGGLDANGGDVATDLGKISDENDTPATGVPFDQDPNFDRCTDVDFAPVYFGLDASNLAASELAKIEAVAQHLAAQPARVVIVEGNCDERGSNEYNLSLGELRAISVRDYLVTLGVDAQRIQTKSYGEEKPAVSGHDEAAWSKNRRGEFAIFQHK